MAFASARWAKHQDVGALGQPAVSRSHGHDLRLGNHRHSLKCEAVECLARRQMRFGKMTSDPAIGALGQFVLGHGREEARSRPTFAISGFRELGPQGLDCRQAQLIQHDAETCLVGGICRLHAVSPIQAVVATSAS